MRQSQISLSCPGLGEEEGEALGRTAFLGGGIDHHIYSSWVMRSTPFFFDKDMDGPMFDPFFWGRMSLSFGIWTV